VTNVTSTIANRVTNVTDLAYTTAENFVDENCPGGSCVVNATNTLIQEVTETTELVGDFVQNSDAFNYLNVFGMLT